MGLKYGARKFLELLRHGLYNHGARTYTIYVDGELMRYKGLIANNMSLHNACDAIANTAFDYMMHMVRDIESLMAVSAKEIVVYMDGTKRIHNKVIRTTCNQFDTQLIRNLFKSKCILNKLSVCELSTGESELQMYIQRDRTNNLNIFLTSDSDMIAIAYDHRPSTSIPYEKLHLDNNNNEETTATTTERIANDNCVYGSEFCDEIVDSCLWINCSYSIFAVGCDFGAHRLRYQRLAFLVMVGMCGTDFTQSMLTETMICGILKATDDDVNYVNNLHEIQSLVCAFVYLGIKNGGTIKPIPAKRIITTTKPSECLCDYVANISYYIDYIDAGIMTETDTVEVNMPILLRNILTMLGYTGNSFKKSEIATWTQMNDIDNVIV